MIIVTSTSTSSGWLATTAEVRSTQGEQRLVEGPRLPPALRPSRPMVQNPAMGLFFTNFTQFSLTFLQD